MARKKKVVRPRKLVSPKVHDPMEGATTEERAAHAVSTGAVEVPDGMTDDEYVSLLSILIELARTDFLAYYHLFNPQGHSPFVLGKVHRYLIAMVQKIKDGEAPGNTAVSMPPQHGKSSMLSVEAPSWILGVEPTKHVAITGFSHALVTKFSKAVRDRMESPLYQLVFPGIHPVRGSNKADEWVSTKGGGVVAKSAGSKLTGRRVDWLIMDDVHPGRSEAESKILRKKTIEWYFADCFTRLSPNAKQFLIGTRFHPDDLIGNLTSEETLAKLKAEGAEHLKFNVINLPAIAIEGEDDPLGRQPGEALFPEVRPIEFLKGIRDSSFPSYEWDSQFQGQPRSVSSGIVDLSNIQYIDGMKNVPWDDIDEIVRGWDTALSEKQTADYTAGPLVGYNRKTKAIYILHMVRRRLAWAKMKTLIRLQAEIDLKGYPQDHQTELDEDGYDLNANISVLRMGMEGVSGFKTMVDDVKEALLGKVKVELKNPPKRSEGGGSKLLRAQPWLNKIEAGLVYVVRDKWTKDFVDELDGFPDGKFDDQCFVAGTMIATETGERPIENILVGDRVWTRKGLRQVTKLWSKKSSGVHSYLIGNGRTLTSTPGHPVISDHGIISIDDCSISHDSNTCQKTSILSSSRASNTAGIQTVRENNFVDITYVGLPTEKKVDRAYTGTFGNRSTGIYPKAMRSITRTKTHLITPLKILSALAGRSIVESIGYKGLPLTDNAYTLSVSGQAQRRGTLPKKVGGGIANTVGGLSLVEKLSLKFAFGAERVSHLFRRGLKRAANHAPQLTRTTDLKNVILTYAQTVEPSSSLTLQGRSLADRPVERLTPTASVQRVFNLEVEGEHEYFANGLLVHNCDGVSICHEMLERRGKILIA